MIAPGKIIILIIPGNIYWTIKSPMMRLHDMITYLGRHLKSLWQGSLSENLSPGYRVPKGHPELGTLGVPATFTFAFYVVVADGHRALLSLLLSLCSHRSAQPASSPLRLPDGAAAGPEPCALQTPHAPSCVKSSQPVCAGAAKRKQEAVKGS